MRSRQVSLAVQCESAAAADDTPRRTAISSARPRGSGRAVAGAGQSASILKMGFPHQPGVLCTGPGPSVPRHSLQSVHVDVLHDYKSMVAVNLGCRYAVSPYLPIIHAGAKMHGLPWNELHQLFARSSRTLRIAGHDP